jgi:UDP-N-acetyl-D-mannosaminuronic acid dehydrogenase
VDHNYEHDVCVVGCGRIGLPWAVSLAREGFRVVCVDVDADRVAAINDADAPFDEPDLADYLEVGVSSGRLTATTDEGAVSTAKAVGVALNAPQDKLDWYFDTLGEYAEALDRGQVIVNRTTLSLPSVSRAVDAVARGMGVSTDTVDYVTFPERLAEGKAIEEIYSLPKIVGANTAAAADAMAWLLDPFDCPRHDTSVGNAMFVKLMDNAYRDARFAIANQFALIADEEGVNAHEAIELANADYPRNDIPLPGTVGGKCLTKDPYFLVDDALSPGADTPDLFSRTRETNDTFERHVLERVQSYDPDRVAILGTAFKRDSDDEFGSPALNIKRWLEDEGIDTACYDPNVSGRDDFEGTVDGADVVLLAVNHSAFEERAGEIEAAVDCPIVDVWGVLDPGPGVEVIGAGQRPDRRNSPFAGP